MSQHPAQPTFTGEVTAELAWQIVLTARKLATRDPATSFAIGLNAGGVPTWTSIPNPHAVAGRSDAGWWVSEAVNPAVRVLFDLYLPLCGAAVERPLTIGHLGQSLDGHIATESGESCYINGPANITHLHRLRALCDAVVVGASTVASDNPRLTTRLVPGPHPLRVVIDPGRRLHGAYHVFTDGVAPTLVVCAENLVTPPTARLGEATVLGLPIRGHRLVLTALLAALRERGCHSVFVEGGGTTVSEFLGVGLLDRLHLAVAPLIIGSGRPGIRLPAIPVLAAGMRPPFRLFQMGQDVLFDCDLRAMRDPAADVGQANDPLSLARLF